MQNRVQFAACMVVAGMCAGAGIASASTWTNTGGDGLWNNAANWSDGVPNSGKSAVFDDTGSGPATIAWPASEYYPHVGSITFSRTGGFTIPEGKSLYLHGPVQVTRQNESSPYVLPLVMVQSDPGAGSFDVASGSTLQVTQRVSGGLPISFTGAGTFDFRDGSNTGLVGLTIGGGKFINRNNSSESTIGALAGSGTFQNQGSASVVLAPSSFSFTGRVEALTEGGANGSIAFTASGTVNANGAEFYTSTGSRLKYRASTTIVDGTFSGTGQNIAADGNWEYGNATILTSQGSDWKPGNAAGTAGTLSVLGNLKFSKNGAENSRLVIDIAGAGSSAGVDYDQLSLTRTGSSSGGLLSSDSDAGNPLADLELVLNGDSLLGSQDLSGNTYTLISAPFTNFTGASFASVSWQNVSGNLHFNAGSVTLTDVVIAVPEPAGIAVLALSAVLGLRRRK